MRLPVWHGFTQSMRLQIAASAAVGALLVGTVAATVWAFSTPETVQQKAVLASYQQQGQLTYRAMAVPGSAYGQMAAAATLGNTSEVRADREQFASLVDDVMVSYSYSLSSDRAISQAQPEISLSMLLSAPGIWQKELPLLPATRYEGREATATASFKLPQVLATVKGIEQEIGTSSDTHDIRLIARVKTKAIAADGKVLDESFQQEFAGQIQKGILRWADGTDASKAGDQAGWKYAQAGKFGYSLRLLPNLLFADPASRQLPEGWPIYTSAVKSLDMAFSYGLTSSQQITSPSGSYSVNLLLESPGAWSKQFPLVPETAMLGSTVSTSFSLDLASIQQMVERVNKEVGGGSSEGINVSIIATVSAAGNLAGQPIEDSFTQTAKGNLKGSVFTWAKDNRMAASGSGQVAETRSIPNRPHGFAPQVIRIAAGILLALALALAAYLGWLFGKCGLALKPAPQRRDEKTRKKYADVIAAVREVPAVAPRDRVLAVATLEDLVKVAIDGGRPVLRHGANGHSDYCVIDGSTRYVYRPSTGTEDGEPRIAQMPAERLG